MIQLKVEEYCQYCPEFEADVEKNTFYSGNGAVFYDTTIRCSHRERCNEIKKYIEFMNKTKGD